MRSQQPGSDNKFSWFKLILVVAVVTTVISVLTVVLVTRYLFPKEFEPVVLKPREEKVLRAKIDRLESLPPPSTPTGKAEAQAPGSDKPEALEPERYSEDEAKRRISFTERELNALLAQNTDLATKLAIDLSDDLASAKLLVPLEPELPFFGGKTLRVSAGLELRYAERKPVVILKGISVWGVPIPNAWLGGIKNVDLVKEFGSGGGFWQLFSEGVDSIRVEEGRLTLQLKE